MATEMVRTHITLPKELAERFEKLVGARRRSDEIAAMIAARLRAEERRTFFTENAGAGTAEDYPHWPRRRHSGVGPHSARLRKPHLAEWEESD